MIPARVSGCARQGRGRAEEVIVSRGCTARAVVTSSADCDGTSLVDYCFFFLPAGFAPPFLPPPFFPPFFGGAAAGGASSSSFFASSFFSSAGVLDGDEAEATSVFGEAAGA